MDFLHFLQDIRTDYLNKAMILFTQFGSEIAFIIVAVILLWCVNKKYGFRIFAVFFSGLIINEGLKSLFTVQRPFVKDPTLKPVDDWGSLSVSSEGYSFPSGHTATVTLVFGSFACFIKKLLWIIVSAVIIAVTIFSRLYLGAHTPLDVFASFVVSSVIVLLFMLLFKFFDKHEQAEKYMYIALAVVSLAALIFMYFFSQSHEQSVHSYEQCFKLVGCTFGILVARFVDRKYIKFETSAKLWQQIIKVAVGLGLALGLKTLLKFLLLLFLPANVTSLVSYFILMVFIGCIYPISFKIFKVKESK